MRKVAKYLTMEVTTRLLPIGLVTSKWIRLKIR